ncbi:hypothetical protein [Aminobacter sp. LjRoot7]|uniref:hypothetical protein n=1 Tax=Aminobacter sp. LjRoot7 TaxID=3342335 RepID=UPI003ECE80F3
MSQAVINQTHVTKSYHLLELLCVLEHASRNIEHVGAHENDAANMGRSIAFTLTLASEIASELHDLIEINARGASG